MSSTSSPDWVWEDAFDKFGFDDGDGEVRTDEVADLLERHGFQVALHAYGLHNTVITSIIETCSGIEQIPASANTGYDDPRGYLPKSIVDILDARMPHLSHGLGPHDSSTV